MDRRHFVRLGIAGGAGAAFMLPGLATGAHREPRFLTERVVTILLGGESPARLSPPLRPLAAEGTLFTRDIGAMTTVQSYVHSGILSGRTERSQRPDFPTWNEVVRKQTGEPGSKFWLIQGASYHGAASWDVKHYSRHPDYGIRYGATNLTMNKVTGLTGRRSPQAIVDLNVERAIGHSPEERRKLVDFIGALSSEMGVTGVGSHAIDVGDRQSLVAAARILRAFEPRAVTIQLLGSTQGEDGIETLWRFIRAQPELRDSTALVIRKTIGADDPMAHWTLALGPDFKTGHVVSDPVDARDLAPTISYVLAGATAEHFEGRVRTELLDEGFKLPRRVNG